jgi:hypothetical protein
VTKISRASEETKMYKGKMTAVLYDPEPWGYQAQDFEGRVEQL